MRNSAFLLLVVWAAVFAIDPKCELQVSTNSTIFNAPTELQALDLSRYFKGYSLDYSLSINSTEYSIISPFYNSEAIDLPKPIPAGSTRIALDILTDQNLAWQDQGASLIVKGSEGFTVAFADLTKNVNLNFTNEFYVAHFLPSNCFDLTMIAPNVAFVDCQSIKSDIKNLTDYYYIVNAETRVINGKIPEIGFPETKNRKTITYALGDDIFILTSTLYDNIDSTFVDNTYINVYSFDPDQIKTNFVLTIDAIALGLDTLRITDIAQDENKFIYITHNNSMVIRFKYLASNRIDKIQHYRYTNFTETFNKVAVIVDHEDVTRVVIAGSSKLIELIWNNEPSYFREYEFGEFAFRITDLQINSRMIMIESTSDYYFYRIGDTAYSNLLYTTPNLGSIGLLSQTAPQAVVVGNLRSLSYIVSNGYFEINRPAFTGLNTTVTVTATSTNKDGQKATCSIDFLVSVVNDTSQIQVYKQPPTNLSVENPASLRFKLSEYITGPQLNYETHNTTDVNYELQHIEDIDLNGPSTGYTLIDTYAISSTSYYRLSASDSAIQIDKCSRASTDDTWSCESIRNIGLGGKPLAYSIFHSVTLQEDTSVIGVVSSVTNNTVNFYTLEGDKQYKDLLVDPDCIINDLDITDDFIYVTSSATSSVYIYRTQVDYYTPVTTLDRNAMTKLVPELDIFKPRELAISPLYPNILFVKNADSVIILKVNVNKVTFISNIRTVAPTSGLSERIVVGSQNFLIVRAANGGISSVIQQYGIYDIFRPIFMREIELFGYDVVYPVRLTNSFGGDFVYVKTVSTDGTLYSVTALRMGKPAVSSNYYMVNASKTSGFASVDLSGVSLLQVDSVETSNDVATISKKLYYEPYLSVSASVKDGSFIKRFTYGITVTSSSTALNFDTNLDVVDYQATIIPNGTAATIKLPAATNSLSVPIEIDSWFTGSIAHYDISCPYCDGKQVRISDHVSRLSSTNIPKALQYAHFREDKKLWILSSSYISIANEDKLDELAVVTFDAANETTCSNWVLWDSTSILVYCSKPTEHFFLLVQSSADHSSGRVVGQFTVDADFRASNVLKIQTNAMNRLFVLDASSYAGSVGKVIVFNVKTVDNITITGQAVITANDFGGAKDDKINDFEILTIPTLTPERYLMLATLNAYGLAYGVFDPSTDAKISFLPIGAIKLRDSPILRDYQISNNFYLQIEHVKTDSTPQSSVYNVIITTSFGEHLQLILNYKIDPTGISFVEFNLVNVYSKYGNEFVLNWATSLPFSTIGKENYLAIGYYDLARMITSVTLYPIAEPNFEKPRLVAFFSALELIGPINNPSAFLFNSSKNDVRLVTNYPVSNTTTLSTLSHTVYLLFNYDKKGQFDSIDVNASNLLSSSTQKVTIDWDAEPTPAPEPDDEGGLEWYVIVAIAVGVLLIVLVALFFYMKARKNRKTKDSLLADSKVDVDEQI